VKELERAMGWGLGWGLGLGGSHPQALALCRHSNATSRSPKILLIVSIEYNQGDLPCIYITFRTIEHYRVFSTQKGNSSEMRRQACL
jgi:hypothetical protein